jgi:hypothetical protein
MDEKGKNQWIIFVPRTKVFVDSLGTMLHLDGRNAHAVKREKFLFTVIWKMNKLTTNFRVCTYS